MESRPGLATSLAASLTARLERALRRRIGAEMAEAMWGDLLEESAEVGRRRGPRIECLWILWNGARLVAGLVIRQWVSSRRFGAEVKMDGWSPRRRRLAAGIGLLAILPAAVLVAAGLLFSLSGDPAVVRSLEATVFDIDGLFYRLVLHPLVVLGGVALALAVNLIPLIGVQVDRGGGVARATFALRMRRTHLAIAAVGLGLMAVLLGYAFTENFSIIARPPAGSAAAAPAVVPGAPG
jgi:hypothetical protein